MPGNRFSLVKDIHGFPLKIQHNATDDQDADEIPYSNTASGLTATDLQAALDEVAALNANVGMTDAERAKLGGIEPGAAADQTGAEIKTAYEAEANTNAFTDADEAKLDGIEAGATADQSSADIRGLGFFDTSNDGSGSGLDADLLDGAERAAFAELASANEFTANQTIATATVPSLVLKSDNAAALDFISQVQAQGKNDAAETTIYSNIVVRIIDPADGLEDGETHIRAMTGGSPTTVVFVFSGGGNRTPNATGGGQGADTINFKELYDDGEQIFPVSSFTVATVPANGNAGRWIHVTNETGGAVDAFDDGTDWRRCTDRAIVA